MQCPILAVGREKEEGREGRRLDDGAQGALFLRRRPQNICAYGEGRREGREKEVGSLYSRRHKRERNSSSFSSTFDRGEGGGSCRLIARDSLMMVG